MILQVGEVKPLKVINSLSVLVVDRGRISPGKTEVTRDHTVDGQNQENPGWYKTTVKELVFITSTDAGFNPPTFRKTALAVNLHQLCLKNKVPAMFSRYLLLHFLQSIQSTYQPPKTWFFPTDRDIQPSFLVFENLRTRTFDFFPFLQPQESISPETMETPTLAPPTMTPRCFRASKPT